VKKGYNISALILLIWGSIIMLVFWLWPDFISSLFFYKAEEIACSSDYLKIIGLSEPFMCVELLAVGALSGLGKTNVCSFISVILTVIRIPMAYALSRTALGVNGVWIALTISSVLKGIVLHIAFVVQCKKLNIQSE
jgi:Na+-driven multidrug efflux pump